MSSYLFAYNPTEFPVALTVVAGPFPTEAAAIDAATWVHMRFMTDHPTRRAWKLAIGGEFDKVWRTPYGVTL